MFKNENTGLDPVALICMHLRLLQTGNELDAEEPLVELAEHLENRCGWVPTKKQVMQSLRNYYVNPKHLDFTYLHTFNVFKHW